MIASHAVLLLGLAFLAIVLFSMFFLTTAASWGAGSKERGERLTLAEWMERTTREDDDA